MDKVGHASIIVELSRTGALKRCRNVARMHFEYKDMFTRQVGRLQALPDTHLLG